MRITEKIDEIDYSGVVTFPSNVAGIMLANPELIKSILSAAKLYRVNIFTTEDQDAQGRSDFKVQLSYAFSFLSQGVSIREDFDLCGSLGHKASQCLLLEISSIDATDAVREAYVELLRNGDMVRRFKTTKRRIYLLEDTIENKDVIINWWA